MFKLVPIIIGFAVASVAGCSQPAANEPTEHAKPGQITDGEILAYGRKARDEAFLQKMEGQRQVLGLHHGTRVVVDFPCSDICPDNTVAIIHYDVEPDQNC